MKKTLCWTLTLLLSFGLFLPSIASVPEGTRIPELKTKDSVLSSFIKPQESLRSGSAMPVPNLKLTVRDDGSYIITSDTLSISTRFPFGWFVFTQDYLTQLDLYINMVNDINALVTNMMENEQWLMSLDGEFSGAGIDMYVKQSELSAVFGDLSKQDRTVQEAVLLFYQTNMPKEQVKLEQFGENTFITVRYIEDGTEMLVSQTFGKGVDIIFAARCAGNQFTQYEMDDFISVMESVMLF